MRDKEEEFDEEKIKRDFLNVIASSEDDSDYLFGILDEMEICDEQISLEKNIYNLGALKPELQQLRIPIINLSSKQEVIINIFLSGKYNDAIFDINPKIAANSKYFLDLTLDLRGRPSGLYDDVLTIIFSNKQKLQVSLYYAIDLINGKVIGIGNNYQRIIKMHLVLFENTIISNLENIEIFRDLNTLSSKLLIHYKLDNDLKCSEVLYLSYPNCRVKKLELLDNNLYAAKIKADRVYFNIRTSRGKSISYNNNGNYLLNSNWDIYTEAEIKREFIDINILYKELKKITLTEYPDFINIEKIIEEKNGTNIKFSIDEKYYHKSILKGELCFKCETENQTTNYNIPIKVIINNNIKIDILTKAIKIGSKNLDVDEYKEQILIEVEGNGKALIGIGSRYINHAGYIKHEYLIEGKSEIKYPIVIKIKELLKEDTTFKKFPIYITYEDGEIQKSLIEIL